MPDVIRMLAGAGQVYHFGPYHLSIIERKLWSGDQLVHLTPKVFDTLAILLQNRDRVVSKQDLLDAIWPDRFVEEANLTQNISVLRKALGETNSATKYIATFPGKGYRFIAEVEEDLPVLEKAHTAPTFTELQTALATSPAIRHTNHSRWLIAAAIAGALAALFFWRSRVYVAHLRLGAARSITHLAGRAYQPAISPDGHKVAFVLHDAMNGPRRLEIVNLSGGSQPYIVPSNGEDMFSPTWSPDGSSLAFLQFVGSKLYVMIRKQSGELMPVIEVFPHRYEIPARQLDWSPDGTLLAISDKESNEDPFSIELIHIAERRKITLTRPPALSDGDFEPRFSPDGKRLAFIRQKARYVTETFFIDLPGSDLHPIPQATRFVGDIDWTPDSSAILASASDVVSSYLSRVQIATGKPSFERSRKISSGPVEFSVSRISGKLVFGAKEPEQNIWRATVDDHRRISKWEPWIVSKEPNFYPVYSDDGKHVAFLSERSGSQQVWVKDGNNVERQLTFGDLRPWYMSWTSANDIAFSSLNKHKIYRLSPAGKFPEPLPIPSHIGSHTAISPDGKTAYFVRRFYIFSAPTAGGAVHQLTDEGGFPLRLSADGKWLYYVRNRFSNEIWRVNTVTGRAEKMTNRLAAGFWASWCVYKNELIYLSQSDGPVSGTLERLDLTSGKVSVFGELPGRLPSLGMGSLTFSPDGKFLLAVVAQPDRSDLNLITEVPWTRAVH